MARTKITARTARKSAPMAQKESVRNPNAYFKFGSYFKVIMSREFGVADKKAASKMFVAILNSVTVDMILKKVRKELKFMTMNADRLTIMEKDVTTYANLLLTKNMREAYQMLLDDYKDYEEARGDVEVVLQVAQEDYEKSASAANKSRLEEAQKNHTNFVNGRPLVIPKARVEKTLRGKDPNGFHASMDENDPNIAAYLKQKNIEGYNISGKPIVGEKAKVFKFSGGSIAASTALVQVLITEILLRAGLYANEEKKKTLKVRHLYQAVNNIPSMGVLLEEDHMTAIGTQVNRERDEQVKSNAARTAKLAGREKKPRQKKKATKKVVKS